MSILERAVVTSSLLIMLGTVDAKPMVTTDQLAPRAGIEEPAIAAYAASPHAELTYFLVQPVDDPDRLRGYRIAILASDGVDGFDLELPRSFLAERGATVHVLIPRAAHVLQATGSGAIVKPKTRLTVLEPSGELSAAEFDRFVDQVRTDDYDIVYVPGNRARPLPQTEHSSIAFLREAARTGKSIFTIGNSSLILLQAGLLDGRRATGDPDTLEMLARSTATAADAPLVRDGTIFTSRNAFDMPTLMDQLIATLLAQPARTN
jgi:protease I